jgi:hypothetical protein
VSIHPSEQTLEVESGALSATAARLAAWISSGACQALSGAFVAWVALTDGTRAFDYPEITGYALTYLAARPVLSERESAAGHRAAEWLDERIRSRNLAARDGWDNGAVYLFDLGVIASGLLTFGGRTGTERFVDSGLHLVGFLERELTAAGPPAAVARSGPPSSRANWSTRGQPHLTKLVQAFLLADELGSPVARSASARIIDAAKSSQEDDGSFCTDPGDATVMLHPHLYSAEGLWVWGTAVGDEDALDRARAAVDWVWTHQLANGGLPARAHGTDEQSDVTAQAVRLAFALDLPSEAQAQALERMNEIAVGDERGLGLPYQPDSPDVHVNTWATLFATQSFALAAPDARPVRWPEWI